jgi:hypothetical protein
MDFINNSNLNTKQINQKSNLPQTKMKRQLLILTLVCISFTFTDCNKKSDPQPASTIPTAPTTASGNLIFDGTTRNLTIYTSTSGTYYTILGEMPAPRFILSVSFPDGKPTASKIITLSGASSDPIIGFQNNISEYKAVSGTVLTVTIIGTTVSVSIPNSTFKDRFSANTVVVSGKLIALN